MTTYRFRLSAPELITAQNVGDLRYERVVERGLRDPSGRAGILERERHRSGASAEFAWSLMSGEPWDQGIEGKRPDVGPYFVRSSGPRSRNLLLHYPKQQGMFHPSPDHPGIYVLALGQDREWEFVGWASFPDILAQAIYNPTGRGRTTPCYWVDRKNLNGMELLPEPEGARVSLNEADQQFYDASRPAQTDRNEAYPDKP